MDTTPLDRALLVMRHFGELLSGPEQFRGEVSLEVKDPARIADVCAFAKTSLGFDYLVDISSIDHYGEEPRFEVVYELYGTLHHQHLRLKVRIGEDPGEVPTVTGVWRTADWHEREIYDMMGIRFRGHPDLRRILMWEGYPYHPLRKDFPLAGKPTELPGVAFTQPSPMEGGPFVTQAGGKDAAAREPRVRQPEETAAAEQPQAEAGGKAAGAPAAPLQGGGPRP